MDPINAWGLFQSFSHQTFCNKKRHIKNKYSIHEKAKNSKNLVTFVQRDYQHLGNKMSKNITWYL